MNLNCSECGTKVPEELVEDLKQGEEVYCENCGMKITPQVLSNHWKDRIQSKSQVNEKDKREFPSSTNNESKAAESPNPHVPQIKQRVPTNFFRTSKRPSFLVRIKNYFLRLKFKIKRIFRRLTIKPKGAKKGRGRGRRRRGR